IERAEALRGSVGSAGVGLPAAAARDHDAAPASPGPPHAALRREGDYWTVTYGDVVGRVKDLKGLHYLARLLRSPGQEFHVLDLMGAEGDQREAPADGPLPLLDDAAKTAYRRRLGDLRAELAEAERCHDLGRAEQAREEIEALTQQLAAAMGLGGRNRPAGAGPGGARSPGRPRRRAGPPRGRGR